MRRATWLCASFLLGVFASACSSEREGVDPGRQSTASMPTAYTDRDAARAFLSAIQAYIEESRPSIRAGVEMARKQQRSCPDLAQHSDSALQMRIDRMAFFVGELISLKLRARNYERLSETLESISTENRALRTVAKATKTIADEVGPKLQKADIDLCSYLREWKRTGWMTGFEKRILVAPYEQFHVDPDVYTQAAHTGPEMAPQIEELGLTFQEALRISSVTLFMVDP